ncbi:MAG: ATP synthase F0 subunit B, partial [Chloroflexi bacterium]
MVVHDRRSRRGDVLHQPGVRVRLPGTSQVVMYLAGEAGVIDINGTVVVELITFLVMLAILARWVYPEVVRLAEARQRAVAEQLREAERAKADAETRLKEAQAQLDDARKTAQDLIDA